MCPKRTNVHGEMSYWADVRGICSREGLSGEMSGGRYPQGAKVWGKCPVGMSGGRCPDHCLATRYKETTPGTLGTIVFGSRGEHYQGISPKGDKSPG